MSRYLRFNHCTVNGFKSTVELNQKDGEILQMVHAPPTVGYFDLY